MTDDLSRVHEQVHDALDAGRPAEIPLNGLVVCDSCDKDYTSSDESGGFQFGGYAYGPCCAERTLASIRGYGEEWNIKGHCPPGMPFADWVRDVVRGGNDSITIRTGSWSEAFGGDQS